MDIVVVELDPVTTARNDAAIDALLLAAGLQAPPEAVAEDLQPLTEEALDALWATMPAGTPLSQIIDEDRMCFNRRVCQESMSRYHK